MKIEQQMNKESNNEQNNWTTITNNEHKFGPSPRQSNIYHLPPADVITTQGEK
jgi:hypothetical protein